jgi:hypothetical protein
LTAARGTPGRLSSIFSVFFAQKSPAFRRG